MLKLKVHAQVIQELTWMAENKIDYVTIADANFGVFTDRDLEVTEKLVELQEMYGYPKSCRCYLV